MTALCRYAFANRQICFLNRRNIYASLGMVSVGGEKKIQQRTSDCALLNRRGFRSVVSNLSNKLTSVTSTFRTGKTGLVIDGIIGLIKTLSVPSPSFGYIWTATFHWSPRSNDDIRPVLCGIFSKCPDGVWSLHSVFLGRSKMGVWSL